MSKEPISISFCISDNYAQHMAVVIASIIANNPGEPFVFHVLHSNVTSLTAERLAEYERTYDNVTIKLIGSKMACVITCSLMATLSTTKANSPPSRSN